MHLTLLVAIACCPSVNPEQLLHYPLWQQLTAWLNVPISQFGKDKDKAKDKACQSSKDNARTTSANTKLPWQNCKNNAQTNKSTC